MRPCFGCRESIADGEKYQIYEQKFYHAQCMKCYACNNPIVGQVGEKDGRLYCKRDFEAFIPKCYNCARAVSGVYTTALGKSFHESCFLCYRCQLPLAQKGEFTLHDNRTYCAQCASMEPVRRAATTENMVSPLSPRTTNISRVSSRDRADPKSWMVDVRNQISSIGSVPQQGGRNPSTYDPHSRGANQPVSRRDVNPSHLRLGQLGHDSPRTRRAGIPITPAPHSDGLPGVSAGPPKSRPVSVAYGQGVQELINSANALQGMMGSLEKTYGRPKSVEMNRTPRSSDSAPYMRPPGGLSQSMSLPRSTGMPDRPAHLANWDISKPSESAYKPPISKQDSDRMLGAMSHMNLGSGSASSSRSSGNAVGGRAPVHRFQRREPPGSPRGNPQGIRSLSQTMPGRGPQAQSTPTTTGTERSTVVNILHELVERSKAIISITPDENVRKALAARAKMVVVCAKNVITLSDRLKVEPDNHAIVLELQREHANQNQVIGDLITELSRHGGLAVPY
eukprot:TRINITY_DN12907_c0_g1_i1.p1 TRINITY_DN12907_c0_g1~~TRINITY_DN12907_c0_g1_i1.p1  ORF type:complete len:508 (+),score=3.71 TRINITY_DN12907_c0_g1_i1:172-1695(+)